MPDITLPTPGVTPGPQYATQINSAITAVNSGVDLVTEVVETGRLSPDELSATIDGRVSEMAPGVVTEVLSTDPAVTLRINEAVDDAVATATASIIASGPEVATYGTSIDQGTHSQTPWPTQFQTLTGIATSNRGVGGESSIGVVARQGGMPYLLLPDGPIPADTSQVTVSLIINGGAGFSWPLLQGSRNIPGVLFTPAGPISGRFRLVQPSGTSSAHQATDYYTFARESAAAAATPVTRPSAFVWGTAEADRSSIVVLGIYENYLQEDWWYERCLADTAAAVAYLRAAEKRFLIRTPVGSPLTDAEVAAGLPHTSGKKYKLIRELIARYGRNVVDDRQYLIDYGLDDAGLTPTAQDQADRTAWNVPTSLRMDGIHLSTTALGIVAKLVADRMVELGWLTKPTAVMGLVVGDVTASTVSLSWDAVDGASAYVVQWKRASGSYDAGITVSGYSSTVTGLDAETGYTFRVLARNYVGDGAFSAEVSATTEAGLALTRLASDSYARANGAVVGSTTDSADGGNPYVYASAAGGVQSMMSIIDGKVVVSGTGEAQLSLPIENTDVEVSASIASTGSASTGWGPVARFTAAGNSTFYQVRVGPQGQIQIVKLVANVGTPLWTSQAGAFTNGQRLGIRCVGSTVSALVDGAVVQVVSDSAITSGGLVGVRVGNNSAGSFDDLKVSSVN